MIFEKFVIAAKRQDPRNIFVASDYECKGLPEDVAKFYREHNPTDVEVIFDGVNVILSPIEQILALSREYGLSQDQFVIATCNGDPIFLNEGQVFIQCHGTMAPKPTIFAGSFVEFLNKITKQ